LLATQSIVNQILSGSIDVGIALGAESMSSHPDKGAPPFGPELSSHPVANDVTMPMGWTSENLAAQYSISREVQDEYAAQSFQKAERSQNAGWPNDEIHQITTQWVDPKNGDRKLIVVDRDDGVRFGTTKEALAKIRAAFPQWPPSTTTGGNASQISDGVAALLLMRRSKALALGQPIIAKFAASVSSGVEPRIMGAGPTVAIPKLLQKTGLTKQEIDVWEINEAFASVVSALKLGFLI
jgi:acetyl-CoA acyltransferase 1